jgi:NodT family efflux transporter outer membrane factor (OMF) lipoprotein
MRNREGELAMETERIDGAGRPAAPAVIAGLAVAALAALLAACAAGPDYRRPAVDAPVAFRETGPWRTAQPQAIDSDHPWWTLYGDATLAALIAQANAANQTIRQAEAQFRQARAAADAARSGLFPTLGVNAAAARVRSNSSNVIRVGDGESVGLSAGWEPDLWGKLRRTAEAGQAGAEAGAADLAAARLSIQATLAQDYFLLRTVDQQAALYARTVEAYFKALQLTRSQHAAGVAQRSDVALAEAQWQSAEAQRIDLQAQRAQLEHAIAILLGKAPAAFTLPPVSTPGATVPAIPVGLPTDLLERRPDNAGAERPAAHANASIGVARAAYYPSLLLGAGAGYASSGLAPFFDAPNHVWSLGATLAASLFDGGLRAARDDQAVAAYDAAVAQYRQTVLAGFQEVEDNLAVLRLLDAESTAQGEAVRAAQLSERLALSQFRAGTVSYLGVVVAQALALANERAAVQLRGRQLVASVALIKATGGGWDGAAPSLGPLASGQ